MSAINRIRIGGFRRLRNIDLEMRPLMVLIGANGAGKTSLLDAFTLLSASAAEKLSDTLSQMGGIANIVTRNKAKELSFAVEIDNDREKNKPLHYELLILPQGAGYSINKERLSYADDNSELSINYLLNIYAPHNCETSLSKVAKEAIANWEANQLRNILASMTHYHTLDVGPRAPVKLPQQMRPAVLPGTDGEYLVTYLYNIKESEKDRYDTIIDTLHAAFPDFEGLSFPPVAAGMLAMEWKDRNFKEPIYMHELSEGTIRFLWLVSLLQSPALPAITMIDEPEVSLHPELLSLMADIMREASQRTQLIVATHSDRFIRFLNPEEVVVMDVDDEGCATATRADTLDLGKWLDEYTLDEVWRMGQMGGRS